jgi:hypothetical protein
MNNINLGIAAPVSGHVVKEEDDESIEQLLIDDSFSDA